MSQQELADRAFVDISTIQRIEYEELQTSLPVVARLRFALGVPWDALIKDL